MSDMRWGCRPPQCSWSFPHGHKMAAVAPDILTTSKERTDRREFSQVSLSYHAGKSLPGASRKYPLTSHWPEPGHMPNNKPIAEKREWFRSISTHLLGLGVNHLSIEDIAICSMLEQSGSSLSQEEREDSCRAEKQSVCHRPQRRILGVIFK